MNIYVDCLGLLPSMDTLVNKLIEEPFPVSIVCMIKDLNRYPAVRKNLSKDY